MGKSIWDVRFTRGEFAEDDWITVHPNGHEHVGRHVEIDGEGRITKGLGGGFNGMHIGAFKRSWGEKGKLIGKRMTELRDAAARPRTFQPLVQQTRICENFIVNTKQT